MDDMSKYKIRESLEDAIKILDSAPIHPDLVPETVLVQLTNRMPIAHLAIERGLKALIAVASGPRRYTHSLDVLYDDLRNCDRDSAEFFTKAFEDAVGFYNYDIDKRFEHFRFLKVYLHKTGSSDAFKKLRYWALGEQPTDADPIPYISAPVQRELLCALVCLFLGRRETVSERVEGIVTYAMFDGRHITYTHDDITRKQSINLYANWLLTEHSSRRDALEEAVQKGFSIKDDQFVNETAREAYDELQHSKDPAILYFLQTLSYLPKGSQPQISDAVPIIGWIDAAKTRGSVSTPGHTVLGRVEQYSDGAWGIIPRESGSLHVARIARDLEDAIAFLANRLTKPVIVSTEGESRHLRVIKREEFFPLAISMLNSLNPINVSSVLPYDLEFWDANHGMQVGEEVSIVLQTEMDIPYVEVLRGIVTTVANQKVSINGKASRVMKKKS